ncbi:hypothetical protein B0H13DRAFT_818122 [Mycena leptocephala]|nr:hypothetical protein B0H13DRAFT_818122 [Mycena leptocephala]
MTVRQSLLMCFPCGTLVHSESVPSIVWTQVLSWSRTRSPSSGYASRSLLFYFDISAQLANASSCLRPPRRESALLTTYMTCG